jgi:hypothetical protein
MQNKPVFELLRARRQQESFINAARGVLDQQARFSRSIDFAHLDARVVFLENRFIRITFSRKAKGSGLAQTDAVAPTPAREDERSQPPLFIAFAFDHKEAFFQAERAANLIAAQARAATTSYHFHFKHAM